MNERILKLALFCAQQLDWDPPSDPKEYTFTDKGLNEFAELIVKECAMIAYDADADHGDKILEAFDMPYIEE